MDYKIINNNFSANINELMDGNPSVGIVGKPSDFKDIAFGAEQLQYNNTPSEIYNKLYSIFLNIINKSNDDEMKSNPKKYFNMLLSYSLQKGFKRIYNNSFEENYIPEIVGIYDYRPDNKYKGMIIVFDIPEFLRDGNDFKVTFEISMIGSKYANKESNSFTVNSSDITRNTATYMPYIYSHEKLNSIATSKNLRCYFVDVIYIDGKRYDIVDENNIYDVSLVIRPQGKKEESFQSYDIMDYDVVNELDSEITNKSPITSNFGYKELNVNNFTKTINEAPNNKAISKIT